MPVRIKGAAFKQVLDTYVEVRGAGFRDDVIARLPGDAGAALRDNLVLASGMYPIGWYVAMLQEAASVAGGGLAFTHEIGRRSAERDIGTIHRLVFRALSKATVVRQIPRLIGLYYDGGRGVATVIETGRIRLSFRDFAGFEEHAWNDFAGGCGAMLAATGVERTKARIVSGGTADHADIEVTHG